MEDVVDEVLDAPNSDDEEKNEDQLKEKNDEMFNKILPPEKEMITVTIDGIKIGNDMPSAPKKNIISDKITNENDKASVSQIIQNNEDVKIQNDKHAETVEKNSDTHRNKNLTENVKSVKKMASKTLSKSKVVANEKKDKISTKLALKSSTKEINTINQNKKPRRLLTKSTGTLNNNVGYYPTLMLNKLL